LAGVDHVHGEFGWLRSLALLSDLVVLGTAATVKVTDSWLSVRTPDMPTLRLGNAVLFPRPPTVTDVPSWPELLQTEVGPGAAAHGRLAWEGGQPERATYQAFADIGYEPYDSLSMVTTTLNTRSGSSNVSIRLIRDTADWVDLLAFQDPSRQAPGGARSGLAAKRIGLYQTRAKQGTGAWFAGYRDGSVVGCCGVMIGHRIARFQGLKTSPEYRRSGIGVSLVRAASEWALSVDGVKQLVAVVDPDYHALRLFQSIGFEPHDLACGVVPAGTVMQDLRDGQQALS
jgi:RimJ/RimL family protein N-acetyltransferase